jgi:hypothetical protein
MQEPPKPSVSGGIMKRYAQVLAAHGLDGKQLELAMDAWTSELFVPEEVERWCKAGVYSPWEASRRRRKGELPPALAQHTKDTEHREPK